MKLPQIPRPDVTIRDLHAYGGLALAAAGGWRLSPPWTLIGLGLVLFGMGLFLQRKGRP